MDSTIEICNNCGKAGQEVTSKCGRCKAVFYCGKECQVEDWKASHRRLCKQLNVRGSGQLHHPDHSKTQEYKESVYAAIATSPVHIQKFYQLFLSKNTSDETQSDMKRLFMKEPAGWRRQAVLFQSLHVLMQLPKKMALLPTSPLLIALDCGCDPNYISRPPPPKPHHNRGSTALHRLAEMADPNSSTSHKVQVILGRQLLNAGADVNAIADIGLKKVTPLHQACHSAHVTNLSFIRLLLEHGADPNARTVPQGETPLMHTMHYAMPAATLLLTFPSIVPVDVSARSANGSTFLGGIREGIYEFRMREMMASTPTEKAKFELLVKQTSQVEALLVERGAVDGGWKCAAATLYDDISEAHLPPRNVESSSTENVSVLLDKDLLQDGPDWYKELPFWVDDALSIQLELFRKKDHLHTGFNNGTFSRTKKPAVGQHVQITAKLPSTIEDRVGHLSGTVTEVFEEPTDDDLRSSGSSLYGVPCKCGSDCCPMTVDGTRASILNKYGALHGQEAMARVSLSKSDHSNFVYTDFFGSPRDEFDVRLRCDDARQNQWLVVHVGRVTDSDSA